jgi:hypothetical protein
VKNCRQLVSLGSKLSQSLSQQSTNGITSLDSEAKIINDAAGAAPKAIRGDIKTLADAYSGYASQLKKAGIKPGSTPTASQIASLVQVLQKFSTAKVRAAVAHIEAWANKNCGSK